MKKKLSSDLLNVGIYLLNVTYTIFYDIFVLFRRKQFIEKVLDLMQDEIVDSAYKDLVDDLENIRYP